MNQSFYIISVIVYRAFINSWLDGSVIAKNTGGYFFFFICERSEAATDFSFFGVDFFPS